MANIGSILATTFKYIYSKLCRCKAEPADLPKKATLPSGAGAGLVGGAGAGRMPGEAEEIISRHSSASKASQEERAVRPAIKDILERARSQKEWRAGAGAGGGREAGALLQTDNGPPSAVRGIVGRISAKLSRGRF